MAWGRGFSFDLVFSVALYVTNYHRLGGLEHYTSVTLQFCRSGIQQSPAESTGRAGCIPFGGSRPESKSLPFSASSDLSQGLARGLVLSSSKPSRSLFSDHDSIVSSVSDDSLVRFSTV